MPHGMQTYLNEAQLNIFSFLSSSQTENTAEMPHGMQQYLNEAHLSIFSFPTSSQTEILPKCPRECNNIQMMLI